MVEENLAKKIQGLKVWKESDKQYIINHSYIQKIKDYLLKEYGGEISSDPVIRNEYCNSFGDTEDYCSELYIHIYFKQGCISFYIEYNYIIYKKDSALWEKFNAYRESDSVYLQGAGKGKYPKEYRKEYSRVQDIS